MQNTHFVVECRSGIDVLYLREVEEIKLVLNSLEERWKDPENYFFENNKLLPWISVAAYRSKEKPCPEFVTENGEDETVEVDDAR